MHADWTPTEEDWYEATGYTVLDWQRWYDTEAEARAAWDRWLNTVKAEAWEEGHSQGWSDAQDAHDVRQEMARADWTLSTPNPYRKGGDQ